MSPAIGGNRGDNILFECPKRESGCPYRPCRSIELRQRSTGNKATTFALERGGRSCCCMDCWAERSAGAGIWKRFPGGTPFLRSICRAMAKTMRRAIWTVPHRLTLVAFLPCWSASSWRKWMWWDAHGVVQSQCFLPPGAQKCDPWCWPLRSIPGQTWVQDGYAS